MKITMPVVLFIFMVACGSKVPLTLDAADKSQTSKESINASTFSKYPLSVKDFYDSSLAWSKYWDKLTGTANSLCGEAIQKGDKRTGDAYNRLADAYRSLASYCLTLALTESLASLISEPNKMKTGQECLVLVYDESKMGVQTVAKVLVDGVRAQLPEAERPFLNQIFYEPLKKFDSELDVRRAGLKALPRLWEGSKAEAE